jgi:membrane-anchored glycerophosphoryl diester phosphodiesterase (GDPDase)
LFVGFLGFYGMIARSGAFGTNGGIFPEVMSPFTLRSFGVFYFALALAVTPYLRDKNLNALLHHSIASYGLIFFITIAAFAYLGLFDFAARPGGLLYFGAYLGVGIPLLIVIAKYRKSSLSKQ